MKTTTEPLFSNGTDFMWWQDRNCCQCRKAVWYNEKMNKYPEYRCALQRDIEQQLGGIDEINIRTFNMIHWCNKCPMFVDKRTPVVRKGKQSQDDGQPNLFTAHDFAKGHQMVVADEPEMDKMPKTNTKRPKTEENVSENAENEPKKAENRTIPPISTNIAPIPVIQGATFRPMADFDIIYMPGLPADMRERMFHEKCKRDVDKLLHSFTFNEHMCIAFAPLVISQIAWIYTSKVLDYAAKHRIQVLKKLCRAVKHIRDEYIAMLRKDLDASHIAQVEREAQRIHDCCQKDFFIMWLNANTELKNMYRNDPDVDMKTDAYMAVLMIRVLKEHNAKMDDLIRQRMGQCKNTIMNPWMVKLRDCMDAFTGGQDLPFGQYVSMCVQIVHINLQKIQWETH